MDKSELFFFCNPDVKSKEILTVRIWGEKDREEMLGENIYKESVEERKNLVIGR